MSAPSHFIWTTHRFAAPPWRTRVDCFVSKTVVRHITSPVAAARPVGVPTAPCSCNHPVPSSAAGAQTPAGVLASPPLVLRAPATRGRPTPPPRVALQVSMTTPAAQTAAPYTACCGSTDDDSEMPDAATQFVSAAYRRGGPSIGLETPALSAAPAAGARGDEAALQAAWAALGRPEEHEGPSEGEQDYLNDPRHRRRCRTQQRARLKR